jgi:lipopolysaccharide/colanic/teichoic acid biosynthesis glycosyltransferase
MPSFYRRVGKRCFDAVSALCGLLFLFPVFLVTAIVVKFSSHGDVFFRQQRLGRFARPFTILKFRTMHQRSESAGPLLTSARDPRITSVGKWLRKTKLDELPQLLNVLRGDMSLVGPRPEVPLYAAFYSDTYKAILQERPGVTGPSINVHEEALLAAQPDQEAFYLSTILPAKLETDLQYCQNIRFANDLRLVFATPFKIVDGLTSLPKPLAGTSENRT